jgi:hypothetical protein
MSPIGSRHAMCVIRLTQLLVPLAGDRALVSPQNPVRLTERLEPQPDMTVIRARNYEGLLPGPEDVLLLIEVSTPLFPTTVASSSPCTPGRASRKSGSWTSRARSSSVTPARPERVIGASSGRGGENRPGPQRCPSRLFASKRCSARAPLPGSGACVGLWRRRPVRREDPPRSAFPRV